MPELPEVQTIVDDLKKVLPELKIAGFWTDIGAFRKIEKEIVGRGILDLERKGKNILINLSGGLTLLIHQKLTGHLLYGKWKVEGGEWKSGIPGPLAEDSQNRFLHLILALSDGNQLALSDLRKFAKVLVWPTDKLNELPDIAKLGPEPLESYFDFKKFREILENQRAAKGEPRQRRGKIKAVLMDQEVIAGIGNIYSDEILWEAGIHPFKLVEKLSEKELERIFKAMKKVLTTAIKTHGDSMSDYRRPSGEKGHYQEIQNVYRMTGQKCRKKDGGIIKRIKLGGRSAHFCPIHQKLN